MRAWFPLLILVGCNEYGLKEERPIEAPPEDTGEPAPPEPVDSDPPEPETALDTWDLSEVPVDLLFFGDTSGSMAEELTTMGEKIGELTAGLAAYTDDWQLLAVTGPTGCGVNGVLTPETENYADLFAAGILTAPGYEDEDEWGLYNVAAAVGLVDDGECNAGFIRADARLHVIFISDEDDNSPGWDSGDTAYWQPYVDQVMALKPNAEDVRFSGVIGPVPDGCTGAEPGTGYADAIDYTDGALLSICDAWYSEIDELVDISVAQRVFTLSQTPVVETLSVVVNEVPVSLGWAYDASQNAVVFSANEPKTYDRVAVAYEVAP